MSIRMGVLTYETFLTDPLAQPRWKSGNIIKVPNTSNRFCSYHRIGCIEVEYEEPIINIHYHCHSLEESFYDTSRTWSDSKFEERLTDSSAEVRRQARHEIEQWYGDQEYPKIEPGSLFIHEEGYLRRRKTTTVDDSLSPKGMYHVNYIFNGYSRDMPFRSHTRIG